MWRDADWRGRDRDTEWRGRAVEGRRLEGQRQRDADWRAEIRRKTKQERESIPDLPSCPTGAPPAPSSQVPIVLASTA